MFTLRKRYLKKVGVPTEKSYIFFLTKRQFAGDFILWPLKITFRKAARLVVGEKVG